MGLTITHATGVQQGTSPADSSGSSSYNVGPVHLIHFSMDNVLSMVVTKIFAPQPNVFWQGLLALGVVLTLGMGQCETFSLLAVAMWLKNAFCVASPI